MSEPKMKMGTCVGNFSFFYDFFQKSETGKGAEA